MTRTRMMTALALAGALGLGAAGSALAHGPGMTGDRGDTPQMGYGMMGQGMGSGMMGQGYQGRMPMMGGPGMMMGPGMMGPGMMGPGMMGPGMMGQGMGPGMMMGHGMMGQGMGPGMMGGYGSGGMQALPRDLSADEVKHMMEHRVAWSRNPNLKVGEVVEKDDDTITAEIVTKDGSLVRKFQVDRHTGRMQPVQ